MFDKLRLENYADENNQILIDEESNEVQTIGNGTLLNGWDIKNIEEMQPGKKEYIFKEHSINPLNGEDERVYQSGYKKLFADTFHRRNHTKRLS